MKRTHIRLTIALASLLLAAGCGGRNNNRLMQSNIPPVPTSADPWFGTAGNVLVSDTGSDKDGTIDFLWIGFNSPTEWQKFLANTNVAVGGTVLTPANNGLNFYIDPNTTTSVQAGIPEIFTVIDNLKADPVATNLADHTHTWFIQAKVEQTR